MRNRKRERYMDVNLTRYDYKVTSDMYGTHARMEECDDGEFVKFEDVKESLSTSPNTASTPCQYHEWLRLGKDHTGFVWCPYCREAL